MEITTTLTSTINWEILRNSKKDNRKISNNKVVISIILNFQFLQGVEVLQR